MNITATLVAAIVPLVTGFIYYHPMTFGKAWMKHAKLTEEEVNAGNSIKIFGLTLLFSIFMAYILNTIVIHQTHIDSIFLNEEGIDDPNSEISKFKADFLELYGDNFRTVSHGMVHGAILTIFLVFPLLAIIGMLEMKSFKYILVNTGYWLITLMIMGAIICAWK